MTYTNRRTLLNDVIAEDIERGLNIGATLKHAAEAAGVGKRTALRWMEYGNAYERACDEGRDPNPDHEAFYEFKCMVERTRNKARVAASGIILRAALGEIRRNPDGSVAEVIKEPEWKAALAWLERQDPAEWGRTNRPPEADAIEEGEALDEVVIEADRLVSQAAERIAREAAEAEPEA